MAEESIAASSVSTDEFGAFPNSVVSVATSEAAFLGYTQSAGHDGGALTRVPTPITSLADFEACFGGASGTGYGLYEALQLFFGNGGGTAWIVSIGPFGAPAKADFLAGLAALERVEGPAILVAPDALRLPQEEYYELARAMIAHCAGSTSRMAILDLHGGDRLEADTATDVRAALAAFREGLAQVPLAQRSFAAAYYPWIVTQAGTVPPSAAMAGIWARVDDIAGVWMAPANTSIEGVSGLAANIDDQLQEDMNVPEDGLAVNAIRAFTGRGILVWGARTLDGKSEDLRYIAKRRTMTMIERSIARALSAYVFEPNTANTWATVEALISNYLISVWTQGGLAGLRPEDAFSVTCRLGSNMTPEDILEGRLLVTVTVAINQPAEFVLMTFQQQMQRA